MLHQNHLKRSIGLLFIVLILSNSFIPAIGFALTEGPKQPEFTQFEPFNATEMVDLFTGDFTYNIPLFELPGPNGGYPFNLAYQSGVTMDQEASWVGLGWSLNAGAINRQMRGLPDDFRGDNDKIKLTNDLDNDWTLGIDVGASVDIGPLEPKILGVGLGINGGIYYNNYRGVGMKAGFGVDFHRSFSQGDLKGLTPAVGLNISFDSFEGAGVSPSASLSSKHTVDNKNVTVGVSLGRNINSVTGASDLSLGVSYSSPYYDSAGKIVNYEYGGKKIGSASTGGGISAPLSFSKTSYTPYSTDSYTGENISLKIKPGFGFIVFPHLSYNGYYTSQKLRYKNKTVTEPSFGYMYYQDDRNKDGLLDMNLEQQSLLKVGSPNAPIPQTTYDVYSVMGQGVGSMVRPYRSEIGSTYNKKSVSRFYGGGVGLDFGVGHFGIEGSLNYTENKTGYWDSNIAPNISFKDLTEDNSTTDESVYFRAFGESNIETNSETDFLYGDEAIEIQTVGENLTNSYVDKKGNLIGSIVSARKTRRQRANVVTTYTNEEILGLTADSNGFKEVLSEFKIKIKDQTGNISNFNREQEHIQPNHIAGFSTLTSDGARYIYGLPTYNKKHVEHAFSVDSNPCGDITKENPNDYKNHGNRFKSKKEIPPYATSYLLTSVLGNNYVDADDIPGPSDGDLGYWVKFEYQKVDDDYIWRAPFSYSNYQEGLYGSSSDNKGIYSGGEKEIWYLSSVESQTHKADFQLEERQDAKGARNLTYNINDATDASSYRLKKIKVWSKAFSDYPMKTVHLEHNYELLKNGLPNSTSGNGKLTLKKLHFTYENSQKGKETPYVFDYYNDDRISYDTHMSDRWGTYKGGDRCKNVDFPYTPQFNNGIELEEQNTRNAQLWNLKQVTLPTGSKINVEYEADDYAYVQDKIAMQMHSVKSTMPGQDSSILDSSIVDGKEGYRIYFELEDYIPATFAQDALKQEASKYIDDKTNLLYYRTVMNIKGKGNNALPEFVSGYLKIADYGIDTQTIEQSSNYGEEVYTRGWVEVLPRTANDIPSAHPVKIDALQVLRMTHSKDIFTSTSQAFNGEPSSNKSKKGVAVALFGVIKSASSLFSNFYQKCINDGYAENLNLEDTYIRLNSPDKKKFGGGCRVKSIKVNDVWDQMTTEKASEYGQIYEYTTFENGLEISSGVAAYEPGIGGDENALKLGKVYNDEVAMNAGNSLVFEYPVNETLYPGPSVGYSKVTVKSLAADKVLSGLWGDDREVTTTGAIVNEFYTYKDFPVFTEETQFDLKRPYSPQYGFSLFPLGVLIDDKLVGAQGYKIELNNMHGRPKKIANYSMSQSGSLAENPYNYVQYNYQFDQKAIFDPIINQEKIINVLNNQVNYWNPDTQKLLAGNLSLDYDLFHDTRKTSSKSAQLGANSNLNVWPFPPIALPFPLPNGSYIQNELRLAVTNKVIHRGGVLESVESYNQGAKMITKNLAYDKLTGAAILTAVNNNFDNQVYNYNHLAQWEYDGMGAAYENIKLEFQGQINTYDGSKSLYKVSNFSNTDIDKALKPGDELIFEPKIGPGVTLYEHPLEWENKNEIVLTFREDIAHLGHYNFNDKLSSIVLSPGWEATVYKHYNQTGENERITKTEDGAERSWWTDQASSIKIHFDENFLIKRKAYYMGKYGNDHVFHIKDFQSLPDGAEVNFTITRSGARNQLTASAMNVTSLKNPLLDRELEKKCFADVKYPLIGERKMILNECANQWIDAFNLFFKYLQGDLEVKEENIFNCNTCGSLGEFEYGIRHHGNGHKYHSLVIPIYGDCSYYNVPNPLGVRYVTLNSIDDGDTDSFRPFWGRVRGNYTYYGYIPPSDEMLNQNIQIDKASNQKTRRYFIDYESGDTIKIKDIKKINKIKIDSTDLDGWHDYNKDYKGWYFEAEVCIDKPIILGDDGVNLSVSQVPECSTKKLQFPGGYNNIIPFKKRISVIAPENRLLEVNYNEVDSVINLSAQTFTDGWAKNFNSPIKEDDSPVYGNSSKLKGLSSENPYINGERGIWVPHKTYAYSQNRIQSADLNIETDGVINDVPLFNFSNPYFENCELGWKRVNTVTQYDPQYSQIENRDILGNYSAALFDYEGVQSTAVASNAKVEEVGFESFEYGLGNTAGNLMFYKDGSEISEETVYRYYEIENAKGNIIFSNIPYNADKSYTAVKIRANTESILENKLLSRFSEYNVSSTQDDGEGNTIFILGGRTINGGAPFPHFPSALDNNYWKGQIAIPETTISASGRNSVKLEENYAHTGNNSLRFTDDDGIFVQKKMKLQKGKEYVIEAWVSLENPNQFTTFEDDVSIRFNNTSAIGRPEGNIIDGWQKIRFETGVLKNDLNTFTLDIPGSGLNGVDLFVDDIRISPKKSSIQSYVYDKTTYKLKASLDQNNYATFYKYDEEGNLIQIQKETERGIKTIQESEISIIKNGE